MPEGARDETAGALAAAVAEDAGVPIPIGQNKAAMPTTNVAGTTGGDAGKRGILGERAESTSVRWDSWQNYEKVIVNGHQCAVVGDRLYSKHAVDRMQPSGNRFGPNIYQAGGDYGRSIAPNYVEDVIKSSTRVYQPETGNYVYSSGTVKVIVNPEGVVVTIMTYR